MRVAATAAAAIAAVVLGFALVRNSRLDIGDPEPASTDSPRATPTPTSTAAPDDEPASEWEPDTKPGEPGKEPSGRLAAGPRRAARGFLANYLPWQYGAQRAARGLQRWGTRRLAQQLTSAPVRVPADVAARRDRIRVRGLVAAEPFGTRKRGAVALVADGRRELTIELLVVRDTDGWRVSSVGGL